MEKWVEIVSIVLPVSFLLVAAAVAFVLFLRRRRLRHQPEIVGVANLQDGIAKLRVTYSPSCVRPSRRFHSISHRLPGDAVRLPQQEEPVFYWEDHPALVSEAAAGGWSKFSFSSAAGREGPPGSSEFMQAVRLSHVPNKPPAVPHRKNSVPRVERVVSDSERNLMESNSNRIQPAAEHPAEADGKPPGRSSTFSSVMMDLPLPGPVTKNTLFPREAYFEVTVLYANTRRRRAWSRKRVMDRIKLMLPGHGGDDTFDPSMDVVSTDAAAEEAEGMLAFGLSRGGCEDNNGVPGTYSGSIGFFSDGSIFLDGSKLISESTKHQWGSANKVVGCGFNPKKKKVVFTLDSELVHSTYCTSVAFARPLFPTLASNVDVMVLVNLGQKPFAYKPANAWRSLNPRLAPGDMSFAEEEGSENDFSQELFSIARSDPRWRERLNTVKQMVGGGENHDRDVSDLSEAARRLRESGGVVLDIDADSDLFEIEFGS